MDVKLELRVLIQVLDEATNPIAARIGRDALIQIEQLELTNEILCKTIQEQRALLDAERQRRSADDPGFRLTQAK